jgi:glycerol-3-phosphate dehydrogenase
VFTFPWEGVTLIGTTDVDHTSNMETDPSISQEEIDYLLEAIKFSFPELKLGISDVQATFSGIRAVIDTGKIDPSKESREHMLWYEDGMLTITGGKLTTFRLMACQALNLLNKKIKELQCSQPKGSMLESPDPKLLTEFMPDKSKLIRIIGRYGHDAEGLLKSADPSSLTTVGSTPNLWAEVRWAAQAEGIIHLDDLLLRRVRLGILLPDKSMSITHDIKGIIQKELGWDEARWDGELSNYNHLLKQSYSTNSIPG